MDKPQSSEHSSQNYDALNIPVESGALKVDIKVVESAKARLQEILAKKEIAPVLADEIRQKLEDIEAGKVSAVASEELAEAIKKIEEIETQTIGSQNFTGKKLADLLNGKMSFGGGIDKPGAGNDETLTLMAQTAKRYAEDNKS